jgi:hypothetical protein
MTAIIFMINNYINLQFILRKDAHKNYLQYFFIYNFIECRFLCISELVNNLNSRIIIST